MNYVFVEFCEINFFNISYIIIDLMKVKKYFWIKLLSGDRINCLCLWWFCNGLFD